MEIANMVQEWIQKQAKLDSRIYKRFGITEPREMLPHLGLAFKTELGEAANEFRGFKFWSQDRAPRTEKLLEELIDCIHFLLSIGNNVYALHLSPNFGRRLYYLDPEVGIAWQDLRAESEAMYNDRMSRKFNDLFLAVVKFEDVQDYKQYLTAFQQLLDLIALLGFTLQEVERAYAAKNDTNHERQEAGY